jgi:hypothetical protein
MVLWVDSQRTAMDGVVADWEAFAEAVIFLKYFKDMPDPR